MCMQEYPALVLAHLSKLARNDEILVSDERNTSFIKLTDVLVLRLWGRSRLRGRR